MFGQRLESRAISFFVARSASSSSSPPSPRRRRRLSVIRFVNDCRPFRASLPLLLLLVFRPVRSTERTRDSPYHGDKFLRRRSESLSSRDRCERPLSMDALANRRIREAASILLGGVNWPAIRRSPSFPVESIFAISAGGRTRGERMGRTERKERVRVSGYRDRGVRPRARNDGH